jgi:hypothetical protein
MGQSTYEGTWEEVAKRSQEFAGRRVRVTVLEDLGQPTSLDRTIATLLERAETLSAQRPPAHGSFSADTWADDVAEKFRRQGFVL